MSIIDKALHTFGLQRKESPIVSMTGSDLAGYLGERQGYTAPLTWYSQLSMYNENPIAQGCALAFELTIPEAPLVAVQNDKVLEAHPIYDLFEQTRFRRILARSMKYICIGGNAYIHKVRKGRVVVGFKVYSPQHITPVTDKYGNVTHYKYQSGNVREDVATENIIHLTGFWRDASKEYMGESPMYLAHTSILSYNEATQSIYSLHKNDAIPKTAILYEDELTETQLALARQTFAQRHGGKLRGTTAHMWGVKDIKRLALGWNEMGMNDTFMQMEARICSTFRVDPIIAYTYAGLMKQHLAVKEQASRDFTTYTRVPLWLLLEEDLTAGIRDMYPDIQLKFDLTQVQALKPSQEVAQRQAKEGFQAGILTLAEAREAYGKTTDAKTATQTVSATTGKQKMRRKVLNTPIMTLSNNDYFAMIDTKVLPKYDALEAAISDVFIDLGEEVIQEIKSNKGLRTKEIDWDDWTRRLMLATESERGDLVQEVIDLAIVEADGTAGVDDFGKAQQAGVQESANKIRNSIGTIKDEVQQLLVANARATESELLLLLEAKFKTLSESRAAMIARTTTTATTGVTQKEVWTEMNEEIDDDDEKFVRMWVSNPNARDAHASAQEQVENDEGMFTVGGETMSSPAMGTVASNNVNCRCYTRAVRKGKLNE